MSQSDSLRLSDKNILPTEDYIFSIIGEKRIFWQTIMNYLSITFKDIAGSWNYYNDGKQWLFKSVWKKKTILWAAILDNTFRITFWFGDKAEPVIEMSDLPQTIKDNFKIAKKYGSIRSASIIIKDNTDVDNVLKLIDIKEKIN